MTEYCQIWGNAGGVVMNGETIRGEWESAHNEMVKQAIDNDLWHCCYCQYVYERDMGEPNGCKLFEHYWVVPCYAWEMKR